MNQTLQNTKLAGAVAAMALLCGLLLAEPLPRTHGAEIAPAMLAAGSQAAGGLRRDLTRGLDARARRFEAEMAASGPAGEALAIASAAVATSVVESTLTTLVDDFSQRTAAGAPARPDGPARPRHPERSRRAMAMPYFSTASGLARGLGE